MEVLWVLRRICQNSVLTAFELEILDVKEQCTQQMRYMQEALEVFTTTFKMFCLTWESVHMREEFRNAHLRMTEFMTEFDCLEVTLYSWKDVKSSY